MEFLEKALTELIANSPIAGALMLFYWLTQRDVKAMREAHQTERENTLKAAQVEREAARERAERQATECHDVQQRTIAALQNGAVELGKFSSASAEVLAELRVRRGNG